MLEYSSGSAITPSQQAQRFTPYPGVFEAATKQYSSYPGIISDETAGLGVDGIALPVLDEADIQEFRRLCTQESRGQLTSQGRLVLKLARATLVGISTPKDGIVHLTWHEDHQEEGNKRHMEVSLVIINDPRIAHMMNTLRGSGQQLTVDDRHWSFSRTLHNGVAPKLDKFQSNISQLKTALYGEGQYRCKITVPDVEVIFPEAKLTNAISSAAYESRKPLGGAYNITPEGRLKMSFVGAILKLIDSPNASQQTLADVVPVIGGVIQELRGIPYVRRGSRGYLFDLSRADNTDERKVMLEEHFTTLMALISAAQS